MQNPIILQTRELCKSFGGIKAVNRVSFEIPKGSVHGLVGENGAGKSTLIKMLTGVYHADSGEILYEGELREFKTPIDARRSGISVVHQDFQSADALSVTENIFTGKMICKKYGVLNWRAMEARASELVRGFGLDIDVKKQMRSLTAAQKQVVEICKSLLWECRLLILDEPSATLTTRETDAMFHVIRDLKQQGITVIYISHRLEEIFHIADNVTILCDGKVVDTLPAARLDRGRLISMMVGREISNEYPKLPARIGEISLEVRGLNSGKKVHNVSFVARRGEILGFSGLVGSGRTEIANAILGIDRLKTGEILCGGRRIFNRSFKEAIKNGFGLIPEDRKKMGLLMQFSVRENLTMVAVNDIVRGGIIDKRKQVRLAKEYIEKLGIVVGDIETQAQFLSGGNQQKVVIAKWLLQNCEVIFLDEPTRGVDVGAKAEIYKLIGKMAQQGKTVIMISSDLPEILGICDRILVIHQGTIAAEFTAAEATQEKILSYCV